MSLIKGCDMKHFHRVLWLMLIGLLGMVSCAPLSVPEGQPSATVSSLEAKSLPQWQVRLSQSGGFAGVSRRVELDSNGALKVSDENSGVEITTNLPPEALKEIAALVLGAQAGEQKPVPPGSACRDCFNYVLTIERDGERIQVRADDMTLNQVPLEPLISRLLELQKEALSGK